MGEDELLAQCGVGPTASSRAAQTQAGGEPIRFRDRLGAWDNHRFSSNVSLTQLRAALDERRWMMSRG
jgi:hypothetical protein